MADLENSARKDYPWKFDVQKAYRPIDFMERFLKPSKGDYDRMELLPWQHFTEGNLYGWVDKKTGYRRFREGLIIVGSGNGKSTLIVGNAAYGASNVNGRIKMHKKGEEKMYRSGIRRRPFRRGYC